LGTTRVLPAPTDVPTALPPVDPNQRPTNAAQYNGEGVPGDSIGTPTAAVPNPGPPTTDSGPSWNAGDVMDVEKADVRPEFANRSEAQRTLERAYPPLLRDAGVSGRTLVTMIIGRDGRVEPGSVSVQESPNDAFRDPAIRAAERFRFRPAQYHGQTVAVVISLPIDWQIAH